MSKPEAVKVKPVEDYVVTQHGSGPFRAFNFELYAVSVSGITVVCCCMSYTEAEY